MGPSSRASRSGSSTRRPDVPARWRGFGIGVVGWAGLLAAAIAVPNLVFEPASTDLAAQTFRADLWSEHGWVLWNEAWYSGHLVPGYSLIYPPLGALLGPRLVGVVAAILAATAFAALARRHRPGRAATVASLWLAAGVAALLYTGRITFMLGFALGLLALLQLHRPPLAAALAALTALASPVAGLFLALSGAALVLGGRVREGLVLGAGATVATLALVLAFPVGGTQPFGLSSVWFVVVACLLALALVPSEMRTLRIGIALYCLLLVGLYLIATPIGSNAPRLGALLLGPIAVLALFDRRPRLLAIVAVPLLYWQMAAPVGDLLRGTGDPSTEAAFYEPLLAQLDDRTEGVPVRVEVPPTRARWEAVHVAERYPLARGWLRQLESDDIDDFREDSLTPEIYLDWLRANGVSYVAHSDADLDYLSEGEDDLLREGGLPFLREVWSDEVWTLWEVLPEGGEFAPGAALAGGAARVTELAPDRFSVVVPGPGQYPLRLRYTPYFTVAGGNACLEGGGDATTLLTVPAPGAGEAGSRGPQTIEVDARLSLGELLRYERSCSG